MSRLYVLVRSDLDPTYRMVQGMHAVAEHCISRPDYWDNETLVVCKVRTEAQLLNWIHKLERMDMWYASFHEPDLDNQLTAIAVVDDSGLFKHLEVSK